MENLTGGTPPVRYLPCVVPCKLYFTPGEKTLHPRIIKAVPNAAETLHQAAARKLRAESHAGVL
ncbi:hypothetical protein, partial [Dysosmobacter sp. HCP28S3_G4]|uniref:hypothetical protein n=1 Tax=Dysosmobacter sp. HCP28S3_G4 TaxID=3438938 RepID=UPI003F8AE30A